MAVNIEFEGKVKINSVNSRKEIHGDEKKLACDIKMTGRIDIDKHKDIMVCLFGGSEEDALRFWNKEGKPIFQGLEGLKSSSKFEDGQSITIDGRSFQGVTLKGFIIVPQLKRTAEILMTVQIGQIQPRQVAPFLALIQEECVACVDGQMNLLTTEEQALKEATEEQFSENHSEHSAELLTGLADGLAEEAMAHCAEYDRIGAAMLAVKLQIEQERAEKILDGLHANSILLKPDDMGVYPVNPAWSKTHKQDRL